jgi:hypothetical protein
MNDLPGWIQFLYKRGSAGHALHTGLLLDLTNESIAEEADAHPGGRQQLREVALSELESGDLQNVALSLVYLSVVGQAEDLNAVERFANHGSDLVQRAARTCQYQLHRVVKPHNSRERRQSDGQ